MSGWERDVEIHKGRYLCLCNGGGGGIDGSEEGGGVDGSGGNSGVGDSGESVVYWSVGGGLCRRG